jgi:hypothetical protein
MALLVNLDWLSLLLITGATVPAVGATVFGYVILRRRDSLPGYPATASNPPQRDP